MPQSDWLIHLLALREQCRGSFAALSARLLAAGGCEPLLSATDLRPTRIAYEVAARQAAAIRSLDIDVVPIWELPLRLRNVRPAAPALFLRGDRALLAQPSVAIVGSRRASPTAQQWAAEKAKQAVGAGKLVVSGGALGVDSAAHRAAIDAGGVTLAYVGAAIDRAYPAANKPLFAAMLRAGGGVASEHPPMAAGMSFFHAQRNRFIAAQAETLLIAEAARASGTLGTARFARRLGTPIVVSPPGVGRERAGLDQLTQAGWATVDAAPSRREKPPPASASH